MIEVVLIDREPDYGMAPVAQTSREVSLLVKLANSGYRLQTSPGVHLRYWLEFDTEEEAVLFKLTHL